MTPTEVRKLSDEELAKWLSDLRRQTYTLKVQQVTEKIEDNSRDGKTRRDIARLLTEQTVRRRREEASDR
jgi:ribosomal protein L29